MPQDLYGDIEDAIDAIIQGEGWQVKEDCVTKGAT